LLRLGPSVDLIEKEYGLSTFMETLLCFGDDLDHIFLLREDSREVVELCFERVRYDSCKTRLATSWRSPEKDRGESAGFYELAYWLPFTDEVCLSDEIIYLLWSEEGCEWGDVF
jgi:hypothetical protein